MRRNLCSFAAAAVLLALTGLQATWAQKPGGVLRMPHLDSPASMSIHEEATFAALAPVMAVFNNLAIYNQHVPQSSLQSIVPDVATDW